MPKLKDRNHSTLANIFLIATGAGIGWLVGLSTSPVVSIVITSVTGAAAAVVAALSGLRDSEDDGENAGGRPTRLPGAATPVPIAMLVIGLFIGSISGVWVRSNGYLRPRPPTADEINKWTSLGIKRETVVTRFFEIEYPPSGESSAALMGALADLQDEVTALASIQDEITALASLAVPSEPTTSSVLFAEASQEECELYASLIAKQQYDQLRTEMLSSPPPVRELPTIVTDNETLAQIVEKVLCVDTAP